VVESDLDVIGRLLTGAYFDESGKLTGGRHAAYSFEWGALLYQDAEAVPALLAGHYAPTTARRMLSSLRGVLKVAWSLGEMPTEEYQRVAAMGRGLARL
jgi:hypothetical protein